MRLVPGKVVPGIPGWNAHVEDAAEMGINQGQTDDAPGKPISWPGLLFILNVCLASDKAVAGPGWESVAASHGASGSKRAGIRTIPWVFWRGNDTS